MSCFGIYTNTFLSLINFSMFWHFDSAVNASAVKAFQMQQILHSAQCVNIFENISDDIATIC